LFDKVYLQIRFYYGIISTDNFYHCLLQKLLSSDDRGLNSLLQQQTHGSRFHSSRVDDGHYSSEILDELKENISPLRPGSNRTIVVHNDSNKHVASGEMVASSLLITEDMGTPLRRTTFVKADDDCSPKHVTRTPERRIVNADGFQIGSSSPRAVPESYATPVRRTTFVKRVRPECERHGQLESGLSVESLQENIEKCAFKIVEARVESHNFPETGGKSRPNQKAEDLLRDVTQSPLILEDRLLNLQEGNPDPERPRRSTAYSRCSPTESEYHTAVTTPFDESLSENEDADEFVDSNICSETITGDVSLCQQHLVSKASRNATFNGDGSSVMETMPTEDFSQKELCASFVDWREDEVKTTVVDTYEVAVHTEVVSEVLESEIRCVEIIGPSYENEMELQVQHFLPRSNAARHERKVADVDLAGNDQQSFRSAGSCFQLEEDRRNEDMISFSGDQFSDTGTDYRYYKRLSSTPLSFHEKLSGVGAGGYVNPPIVELAETVNNDFEADLNGVQMSYDAACEKVPGVFAIPFDHISCGIGSQTFSKVCYSPSYTEETDSYDRTYTKSGSGAAVSNVSHARPASRPLFSDNTKGVNNFEEDYAGLIPLEMVQSGVEKAVFYRVGGPTRHAISPGQKRQSLIARLGADGPQNSALCAVRRGHGVKDDQDGDVSPVRKRPLIAVSKPCEYCLPCTKT